MKIVDTLHDIRYRTLFPMHQLMEQEGFTIIQLTEILEKRGMFEDSCFKDESQTFQHKNHLENIYYFLIGEFCPTDETNHYFEKLLSEYHIPVPRCDFCLPECSGYGICKKIES